MILQGAIKGSNQRSNQRGRESLFLLPWPAAISEGVLQAQGGRGARLPAGIAVGPAAFDALADSLLFRCPHGAVDQ